MHRLILCDNMLSNGHLRTVGGHYPENTELHQKKTFRQKCINIMICPNRGLRNTGLETINGRTNIAPIND